MDRPLRVALLSYRSKPHCGGQGIYVRHLSRELAALGHAVEVLSGPPYPELEPGPVLGKLPSLDLYRDDDPFRTPHLREYRDWIAVLEVRSEEHTSELQSRVDLGCHLLLEKKKGQQMPCGRIAQVTQGLVQHEQQDVQ